MEIKRFIDVPLSEFFTFHVYTTFTSDFAGMASSLKLQYVAHPRSRKSPDTRACCQLSRGLFGKECDRSFVQAGIWSTSSPSSYDELRRAKDEQSLTGAGVGSLVG
jgi:hypothetical protein